MVTLPHGVEETETKDFFFFYRNFQSVSEQQDKD